CVRRACRIRGDLDRARGVHQVLRHLRAAGVREARHGIRERRDGCPGPLAARGPIFREDAHRNGRGRGPAQPLEYPSRFARAELVFRAPSMTKSVVAARGDRLLVRAVLAAHGGSGHVREPRPSASLTIASAALASITQVAAASTVYSSSNQSMPKLVMHSGKSGLITT